MTPELTEAITRYLDSADDIHQKIRMINELKILLHRLSPFSDEPVDCVLWVEAKSVEANDYNPNTMATVEKKLLARSIEQDGFTQPVVVAKQDNSHLVVDGFHRYLLGKSLPALLNRLNGYLPVTLINTSRQGQKERIAATIRHNRARGKHQIASMSDIVRDLSRLGWDDRRIGDELGMDADEVLRLKQLSGLSELFASEEFSEAWTIE
ncbi:IbrB-like domain-containing protein [Raoultella planticola]|uniref:IbrB-like domain-containing protein n=1 Tax=Raoultella planticola TaxID=575 RepID=UPI000517408F|nr:ParB/RepB/Spo0J family partition protein [Raoultella planticola]